MTTTITEALAELKTLDKRLDKKREFVLAYMYRQNLYKDPLEKDGGSPKMLANERQAIADLEQRKVTIRRAIANANETTTVTVAGKSKSIAEWLTWRRDVLPTQQKFLLQMKAKLDQVRREASQKGLQVQTDTANANANDLIVNLSETALAKEAEALEETIGTLDGLLSLKNATVAIEV